MFFYIIMYIKYLIILSFITFLIIYLRFINKYNCICNKNRNININEKAYLADKFEVKNYINKYFPYIKTAKVYYHTNNYNDLLNFNYDKLPNKFVIKVNNSAGKNGVLIIHDKKTFKKEKLNKFYYFSYVHGNWPIISNIFGMEKHYKKIKKVYFIEEYLDYNINEYKFIIIDGKIKYITVDSNMCKNVYDHNFNKIKDKYMAYAQCNYVDDKPKQLELMKNFCYDFIKKTKFKFLRIDLYVSKNEVYLGELTFTPNNCIAFNNL